MKNVSLIGPPTIWKYKTKLITMKCRNSRVYAADKNVCSHGSMKHPVLYILTNSITLNDFTYYVNANLTKHNGQERMAVKSIMIKLKNSELRGACSNLEYMARVPFKKGHYRPGRITSMMCDH